MSGRLWVTMLVLGLVFASMGGVPAFGDEGGASQQIGRYESFVGSGDLTENHVTQTQGGLEISGPLFTNTLRVVKDYLDSELDYGWSASSPFTIDGDFMVFNDRSVEFEPLELGSEPVFTLGHRSQVEFQDRPMWVSMEQDEPDGPITLDMDDDNTSGQTLYISKHWLWDRGILKPNVTHQDGTHIPTSYSEDREGYLIEVHHFSYIVLTYEEVTYGKLDNGLLVPHTGETRWYPNESRVEIDVENHLAGTYTVYFDQPWFKTNLMPGECDFSEAGSLKEEGHGKLYLTFPLDSEQTPVTLIMLCDTPGVDILPPEVTSLKVIEFGITRFLNTTGGDGCAPWAESGAAEGALDLGGKIWEFTGPKSKSKYTNRVHACYVQVSDSYGGIFWTMDLSNANGKHLVHKVIAPKDPCHANAYDTSYCISVVNLGDSDTQEGYWFVGQTPAQSTESGCIDTTLGLSYGGAELGTTLSWCRAGIWLQESSGSEARWAQSRSGSPHAHSQFFYGVTQRVPMNSDGDFKGVVKIVGSLFFHCWMAWDTMCVKGEMSWTLDSTKLGSNQAWVVYGAPTLPLGDEEYGYQESLDVVNETNPDAATMLGTTLIGAKLLVAAGEVPSVQVLDIMAAADEALSGFGEKLPWQNTVLDPTQEAEMVQLRQDLLDQFVSQTTIE